MKIFVILVLGAVLVFYTWLVVVRGVQTLWHQHEAESFPHVQGEVSSSEVTTYTGSKGRVYYHALITYQYAVDGLNYTGRRYRYDGHPNDSASVHAIVGAHPPGSPVEVYYNPQDPRDTVLSPAVDSRDVSGLFFMTAMCLGLLWGLLKSVRDMGWGGSKVAGGMKVIRDMRETRVRLPRYQPATVGILATAVLFLAGAAVIAFGLPLTPPWVAGEWCLAGVLAGGVGAYAWQFQKVHSGGQDLVIDESGRSFLLPLTYKRRARTPVSFSEIRAVVLNEVRHQSKGGAYYTYLVTLELKDNSDQKLIDLNRQRAESLAAWLREKFGLAASRSL